MAVNRKPAYWIGLVLLLLSPLMGIAQEGKKIKLLHCDEGTLLNEDDKQYSLLTGNVRFLHDGALMFCDSAFFYNKTNSMEAFGQVHVKQGDTLNAYGDSLYYDGNTRKARLLGDIRFFDNDMQMTTPSLLYDRNTATASYLNGARIISKNSRNVLTSKEGYYNSGNKRLYFNDSVRLEHPDYTMYSDTLQYDTKTEIAYFFGPTTIVSDSNKIYTTNGWYDTRNDVSQFMGETEIVTQEQTLSGDTLYYDRNSGIGRAFGNVVMVDTTNDFILTGDYGEIYEQSEESLFTGNTLLMQVYEDDTLFLHADTLQAFKEDSTRLTNIIAYYHVKFYRSDLQGKCDSMSFSETDSLLTLHSEPVLWSDANQLTGTEIDLLTYDGKMERIFLNNEAFIISENDSAEYNQIKGKRMEGIFVDNVLHRINVFGNGQALYWIDEEKKSEEGDSTWKEKVGLNSTICSDMEITIGEQQVEGIRFLDKPEGTIYPTNQLPPQLTFDGFQWQLKHRPLKPSDVFVWEEEKAVEIPEETESETESETPSEDKED